MTTKCESDELFDIFHDHAIVPKTNIYASPNSRDIWNVKCTETQIIRSSYKYTSF